MSSSSRQAHSLSPVTLYCCFSSSFSSPPLDFNKTRGRGREEKNKQGIHCVSGLKMVSKRRKEKREKREEEDKQLALLSIRANNNHSFFPLGPSRVVITEERRREE